MGEILVPDGTGNSREPKTGEDLLRLIFDAASKFKGAVMLQPLNSVITQVRRKNDKRNADIRFSCPDEIVKNLTGDAERTDVYVVIQIKRDAYDRLVNPSNILDREGKPIVRLAKS